MHQLNSLQFPDEFCGNPSRLPRSQQYLLQVVFLWVSSKTNWLSSKSPYIHPHHPRQLAGECHWYSSRQFHAWQSTHWLWMNCVPRQSSTLLYHPVGCYTPPAKSELQILSVSLSSKFVLVHLLGDIFRILFYSLLVNSLQIAHNSLQ